MKTNFKVLAIAFAMLLTGSSQAQEILTGIQSGGQSERQYRQKSSQDFYQTLPFFDDFSTSVIYPDSSKWSDRNILINSGFPVFPTNYKAATFDVLDSSGAVYPYAISNPFISEYLTSVRIRLDSVFYPEAQKLTPADSLYFSFYYQPQGNGNKPEAGDSLVLEFGYSIPREEFVGLTYQDYLVDLILFETNQDTIFPNDTIRPLEGCNPNMYVINHDTLVPGETVTLPCDSVFTTVFDTVWNHVWSVEGQSLEEFMAENGNQYFKQVMIPIKDLRYFTSNFFVRFYNYASIVNSTQASSRGNEDNWSIDFVYLNKGRSLRDTSYAMVSFSGQAPTFLKRYQSMPYRQYRSNPISATKESLQMYITNLDSIAHNTHYTYTATQVGGNHRFSYDGGSCMLSPYYISGFQNCDGENAAQACPYVTSLFSIDFTIDSMSYIIKHYISDSSNTTPMTDSLVYHQGFYNYYAYDDGIPEMGYGVEPANSAFASQFALTTFDTLCGVQLLFNHTLNDANDNYFDIVVWKDNNGRPGEEVYRLANQRPKWEEQAFKFSYYQFEKNILLNSVFYIGIVQQSNGSINIGFDTSIDNQQYNFFNTGNGWQNSQFAGSLMIRPVVGGNYYIGVDENQDHPNNISLYPIPASQTLYISGIPAEEEGSAMVNIFDLTGRMVQRSLFKNEISVAELNSGMYFYNLTLSDGKVITKKFTIKR
jgi:hypothetical protein